MTRRERLERKLEKRKEWTGSRKRKAEIAFKKTDLSEKATGIPFGQPILVGHHSERRHRKIIERADNAMRRSVEHAQMAEHHEQKAAGLENQLDNSIFSDDTDAIERLKERIAEREGERFRIKEANKIIRQKPKYKKTPEKIQALIDLGLTRAKAEALFEPDYANRIGIPSYVLSNLGANIRRDKKRLEEIQYTRKKHEEAAQAENGVMIAINGDYAFITFAEKPDYEIRQELKSAGYHWNKTSWVGKADQLPDTIKDLAGSTGGN